MPASRVNAEVHLRQMLSPVGLYPEVRQTSCHRPSGWMSRWAACCVGAEFELAIFRKSTAAEVKRAKHVGAARAAAPRVVAAEYDEARDRLTLEFDQDFAVAVSLRGFQAAERSSRPALSRRIGHIHGSCP